MRRVIVITLLGLGIVAMPARAANYDVTVANNAFAPAELTIEQGDVVSWVFAGPDTNHSTTSGTDHETSWDSDRGNASPNHAVGDRFSKEFQATGEFAYSCKVHAFMTGKISVAPRGQPVPLADDVVAPRLATPRISVKRRRVNFKLDEAATVQGKLRGRRTRRKFKMDGRAGTNVLKLPRMRPGRYALALWATDDAGNKSVVVRRKFTVRRARR